MIQVKRVYDRAEPGDGRRFLVDRLWPRGLRKQTVRIEAWLKEVAPSVSLRGWFAHDPEKWRTFQRRYFAELDRNPGAWHLLLDAARKSDITLLFSAKDVERNNAVALKSYLEKKLRK